VKSENLYGQTYGKTSFVSSAGTFERGIDQTPNVKFNTTMKNEFMQHDASRHETTAQIVGVNRGPEQYSKPVPPQDVMKFYGVDLKTTDDVVQQEALKRNAAAFFQQSADGDFSAPPPG